MIVCLPLNSSCPTVVGFLIVDSIGDCCVGDERVKDKDDSGDDLEGLGCSSVVVVVFLEA